ncbi:hypothetical protein SBOR_1849 [Sclerotinia borealis F-4128]|uniref:Uncharacterized protein n=1 Tax=Sclerotinia borealis (strain F-4128) TaxID=1432307 RepID=W9CLV0_SCLBF|nr:hypothetical protein SBOR_1849 [Sclerotinia borealis F-4128]
MEYLIPDPTTSQTFHFDDILSENKPIPSIENRGLQSSTSISAYSYCTISFIPIANTGTNTHYKKAYKATSVSYSSFRQFRVPDLLTKLSDRLAPDLRVQARDKIVTSFIQDPSAVQFFEFYSKFHNLASQAEILNNECFCNDLFDKTAYRLISASSYEFAHSTTVSEFADALGTLDVIHQRFTATHALRPLHSLQGTRPTQTPSTSNTATPRNSIPGVYNRSTIPSHSMPYYTPSAPPVLTPQYFISDPPSIPSSSFRQSTPQYTPCISTVVNETDEKINPELDIEKFNEDYKVHEVNQLD